MTLLVFWLCVAFLIYVYAGFPLLVVIVGSIRNRQVRKHDITPKLSLIIAAYNEEDGIAESLENILLLDYPSEKLEIIVASDGSDDTTESIVAQYAHRGVRLLSLPRRGKIYALNDAIARATGEILVFSDANSIFEKQALCKLVRNFADPQVGGVGGNSIYTRYINSDSCSEGENLYWTYDKWLKQMESLTGSIVSAPGAIYAIRRELYQPLHNSTATDDFAISTLVVEQGLRLVFESEARAYEYALPAASLEFSRKVRLMTRGLRGIVLRKKLLNLFRYGFYSIELFTHKLLRRLVPFFLLILFLCSVVLSREGIVYTSAVVAQLGFYTLAGIGYFFRHKPVGRLRLLYIPFFYCLANAAAFLAFMNLLRGHHIEQWQPQRHTSCT